MTRQSAKTITRLKSLGTAAVLGLALAACGNNQQIRGYLFDPDLANEILPGVDNRASVEATLGSPTLPALFDDHTWYYVSTAVRTRPVFWPDPRWHRVMAVKFADNGAVASVINYDLSSTRFITPIDEKTPTRGRNVNFFQQLFSNIGAVGQGPGGNTGGNNGPGPNG